jgi:indole-3-glycerol phosphate synthase
VSHLRAVLLPVDEAALSRRRSQNLGAPRADSRGLVPSIRSFAQALDRQRQALEPIPVVSLASADCEAIARTLDDAEVAALAVVVEEPQADLARLASIAKASTVPLLRADLLLEEFQIHESRAAGADAVLLHASLLPGESLARLCGAARATHMDACVVCTSAEEMDRAVAARAPSLALGGDAVALAARAPRRLTLLAVAGDPSVLKGKLDALLDFEIALGADPASAFRSTLAKLEGTGVHQ